MGVLPCAHRCVDPHPTLFACTNADAFLLHGHKRELFGCVVELSCVNVSQGPESSKIDGKPPPLIFKARWVTKTEPNALDTIQLIKVVFKLKFVGKFGEVSYLDIDHLDYNFLFFHGVCPSGKASVFYFSVRNLAFNASTKCQKLYFLLRSCVRASLPARARPFHPGVEV